MEVGVLAQELRLEALVHAEHVGIYEHLSVAFVASSDADKVTVTYNERNVGKNKGDNYILAIVRVDNDNPESPVSKITYIPNPFKDSDCFVTQISYDIDKLEQMGKQG